MKVKKGRNMVWKWNRDGKCAKCYENGGKMCQNSHYTILLVYRCFCSMLQAEWSMQIV